MVAWFQSARPCEREIHGHLTPSSKGNARCSVCAASSAVHTSIDMLARARSSGNCAAAQAAAKAGAFTAGMLGTHVVDRTDGATSHITHSPIVISQVLMSQPVLSHESSVGIMDPLFHGGFS